MESYEQTFERSFSSVDYLIKFKANEARFQLTLIELSTAKCWREAWSRANIENLTEKAGSFKQFRVFIQMLISAIKLQNPSLNLQLYNIMQLKQQRAKVRGDISSYNPNQFTPQQQKQRYMILSHQSDFDQKSFPLILKPDYEPDNFLLKEVIQHLSSEIQATRSARSLNQTQNSRVSSSINSTQAQGFFPKVNDTMSQDFFKAKAQNELLKARLKILQESKSSGFFDVASEQKDKLIQELQGLKRAKMGQLSKLKMLIDERENDLSKTLSELENAKRELSQIQNDDFDMQDARSELGQVSHLLEEQQKKNQFEIAKNQKIISLTEQDFFKAQNSQKRIRFRANQLQNELEQVMKKLNIVMQDLSMKSKGISPSRRAGSLGSNYGVNSYKQKSPGVSPSYLNKNRLKTPPSRRPGFNSYSPSSSIKSSGYGRNNNYSPGYRNYSPGSSLNSNKNSSAVAAYQKRNSPAGRSNLKNRQTQQSPGNRSNNSRNNSPAQPNSRLYNPNKGATNRLYSPSGRPRVGQNAFGSRSQTNMNKNSSSKLTKNAVPFSSSSRYQQDPARFQKASRYDDQQSNNNNNRQKVNTTQKLLGKQHANKQNSTKNDQNTNQIEMNIEQKNVQKQFQFQGLVNDPKEQKVEKKKDQDSMESINQRLAAIQALVKQQNKS